MGGKCVVQSRTIVEDQRWQDVFGFFYSDAIPTDNSETFVAQEVMLRAKPENVMVSFAFSKMDVVPMSTRTRCVVRLRQYALNTCCIGNVMCLVCLTFGCGLMLNVARLRGSAVIMIVQQLMCCVLGVGTLPVALTGALTIGLMLACQWVVFWHVLLHGAQVSIMSSRDCFHSSCCNIWDTSIDGFVQWLSLIKIGLLHQCNHKRMSTTRWFMNF